MVIYFSRGISYEDNRVDNGYPSIECSIFISMKEIIKRNIEEVLNSYIYLFFFLDLFLKDNIQIGFFSEDFFDGINFYIHKLKDRNLIKYIENRYISSIGTKVSTFYRDI
uniref:Gamma-secretase subunit PEN-2 n=1 Tax=Parascaris univalens TaxID=6257 RepID=A0A915BH59_PARUN